MRSATCLLAGAVAMIATSGCGERRFQKTAKARPPAAQWSSGQVVAGKALQKTANRDAAFQPCQAQTGTLVDAEAKRQVPVGLALQIELLRVLKLRRIAIRRADAQGQQRACWQVDTAHSTGLERSPIA